LRGPAAAINGLAGQQYLSPAVGETKVQGSWRINIREKTGVLKAALSDSAGFNEFQRAERGGVTFSGLMFYNEEGEEEGGLVYSGKAVPGGQNADVTLTMYRYRQDQNVYLRHEEHKDAKGMSIEDGLSINARPDWSAIKDEYSIYALMEKLSPDQQDELRLRSLQTGKISSNCFVLWGEAGRPRQHSLRRKRYFH